MVFCNAERYLKGMVGGGHNPYFNRWFSAIEYGIYEPITLQESQSLF